MKKKVVTLVLVVMLVFAVSAANGITFLDTGIIQDAANYIADVGVLGFIKGYAAEDTVLASTDPLLREEAQDEVVTPIVKSSAYTVIFSPGSQGAWNAANETYTVEYGYPTPVFGQSGASTSTTIEPNWSFGGWSPPLMPTVLGDVIYTATWYKIVQGGALPNEQTLTYVVNDNLTIILKAWGTGSNIRFQMTIIRDGVTSTSAELTPTGSGTFVQIISFEDIILNVEIHGNTIENLSNMITERFTVVYDAGNYGIFPNGGNRAIFMGLGRDNDTPVDPPLTVAPGWRFVGWNPTVAPKVTGNVTYVAQYAPIDYTVTYNANGGGPTPVDSGNPYHVGNEVTVLSDYPTRLGYRFLGWLYDGNEYVGGDTFLMSAKDVTLVALWTPDPSQTKTLSYTVEYYTEDAPTNLLGTATVKETAWVNGPNTLTVVAPSTALYLPVGYKYGHTDPAILPTTIPNGGVIKVIYVADTTNAETPIILVQPQDITINVNEAAALSLTATVSKGTLSYQWYSNTSKTTSGGTEIAGATSASFNAPTFYGGVYYYYCVVTNTDNEATGNKTATATSIAVSVTIELKYLLTYSVVNGNGTLVAAVKGAGTPIPSGTWVYLGTQVEFTATPDPNYNWQIREWKNNGLVVNGTEKTYDFEVRDTTDVTVEFELLTSTDYNYKVYLNPEKTTLKAGETFYVDLMLVGNINYTQMSAEVVYDTALMDFAGHTFLQGWAASVSKSAADKVAIRSVPSMSMIVGASCSTDIRIVRLIFTAKGGFTGESINTSLSFASALVSPPGGIGGATVAPALPVSFTLQK